MDPQIRAHIALLDSPAGERVGDLAKRKAWYDFSQKYPNADKSKFFAHVTYTMERTATAAINYNTGDGHTINVLSSDSKYWSAEMKKALGTGGAPSGFPLPLTPFGSTVPLCQFQRSLSRTRPRT